MRMQGHSPPVSNAALAKLLPASVLNSCYAKQVQQELGFLPQHLSPRQLNSPGRARTSPFDHAPPTSGNRGFSTLAVHGPPAQPERISGSAVFPIFQSATFVHNGMQRGGVLYTRCNNNPSQLEVAAKIAVLEAGEAALVTASGMAAISTTLLTFLKAGDHMLLQRAVYGGTHDLVHKDLPALGISNTVIDASLPDTWQAALQPTTKVIYVEVISNPTVEVPDLQAVVAFAKQHGLLAIIDNTFATPLNFRPLQLGFHLVLHSATKYLNGHSDVIAGAVVGKAQLIQQINTKLVHFGGALDPHSCFLLHRGIKTLSLRVQQQNINAQALAEFLAAHPKVKHVSYPGLPSHPQHAMATSLFRGCGGVLSFDLHGGVAAAETCVQALQLGLQAPSLGGVETLVTRPAATSHTALSPEERAAAGIADSLIRVAVGIEDSPDLLADFAEALRQTNC